MSSEQSTVYFAFRRITCPVRSHRCYIYQHETFKCDSSR